MVSKNTKMVLADLNDFLKSKHPSSVLQFITGMMVGWTHLERKPSKSDIDNTWNIYFNLLRKNMDNKLSLVSNESFSNGSRKVMNIPSQVYEEEKLDEIITLLESMPPDDAMSFMVEVTVNWCFTIPKNYLSLLPDAPQDESDEGVANAIYKWLVRYYDLWN